MTSTIMREPEVYDVWLMRVEFPDHPGVGKVRPVIVTRVEEDRVSGIVVKVCLCSMVLRPVERLVFSPKER